MHVKWNHLGYYFTISVEQTIMLYTLNLVTYVNYFLIKLEKN